MAVVSDIEKKVYLQKFKWAISYTDGEVTTHKMLEFANQRTGRDIIYKPTVKTMLTTFFGFVAIATIGVLIYTKMKAIWNNWIVWFVGSMVLLLLIKIIYIVCSSGIIYDILHDVPFVGRDPKTGEAMIFAGGVIIF